MYRKGVLILILLISNITISQVNNSWYSNKDKIIIPFDFSNNLIILDVFINEVPLKVILDTGTEKNILFSFPSNDTIELFNPIKTKISGVGAGKAIDALISSNNKLKIKEFEDNDFTVLILNENNINFISKLGKEINGIIGYTFFKDRLIEIDYDRKKIIIHKNRDYLKKRKFKKFSKLKIDLINNKPYVKTNSTFDDENLSIKLLLDTGLSDGLWIFKNDSLKIPELFLNDYLGFGLAGEIHGKRARIEKLQFSNFEFEEVLVAYPDSLSFNNVNLIFGRNGSIGGELLKRFHLFIDYKEQLLYLKKSQSYNDAFNYNMSGIEVQHSGIEPIKEEIILNSSRTEVNLMEFLNDNSKYKYNYRFILKPIFVVSNIRKNSPAANSGILPDDKIISINNRKAHNYTIQKITDLFQSEDGKKIKIEVERDGKIIEVIFYLKKII
ncbi:PDZ domain-containing protein [Flavobacterium gelidilacus]|uniref:PDZ domain-containing protein n=1 Tax=Flavobacterium gelidilacus TaxID=206041 RepID=UPI000423AA65|nr:PDZ domain-containing protein [Flavobacterium gelidilacus]